MVVVVMIVVVAVQPAGRARPAWAGTRNPSAGAGGNDMATEASVSRGRLSTRLGRFALDVQTSISGGRRKAMIPIKGGGRAAVDPIVLAVRHGMADKMKRWTRRTPLNALPQNPSFASPITVLPRGG